MHTYAATASSAVQQPSPTAAGHTLKHTEGCNSIQLLLTHPQQPTTPATKSEGQAMHVLHQLHEPFNISRA
jgi:hypothetical protein